MSTEMTPREHSDMRDLLLAGTQRIRPAGSRRALISAGLALILVAGVVGAVAAIALNMRSQVEAPPAGRPSGVAEATALPAVPLPAADAHATLLPDPALTWERLQGALQRVDDAGLEMRSLQGFQRAGTIQPWTADKKDGSGTCILLRTHDGSLFDEIGCEADGTPASVERSVDGSVLRFAIDGETITVYVMSP